MHLVKRARPHILDREDQDSTGHDSRLGASRARADAELPPLSGVEIGHSIDQLNLLPSTKLDRYLADLRLETSNTSSLLT